MFPEKSSGKLTEHCPKNKPNRPKHAPEAPPENPKIAYKPPRESHTTVEPGRIMKIVSGYCFLNFPL